MSEGPAPSRALLVLSYLGPLGVIPLLSGRKDPEVHWHARNGVLLFGAVILISVVATAVGIIVPALSCMYGILMFTVAVMYTVIVILAIVKALDGQRLIVPGISRLARSR
jgi:uncharacterized membrane protein